MPERSQDINQTGEIRRADMLRLIARRESSQTPPPVEANDDASSATGVMPRAILKEVVDSSAKRDHDSPGGA